MLFSSMIFLWIFLPLVMLLYRIVPKPWKNGVLLFASLIFYSWGEPKYVLLLIFSVTCNYFFGRILEEHRHWLLLAACVLVNLGMLGYFKYFNLSVRVLNMLCGREVLGFREIVLPLGISFYTFQILSYVIDVYRGEIKAQKHYGRLMLYVSFFPQLIAGPIVKYKDIADQIGGREHSEEKIFYGIRRFIYGLGKKVLISNTVAYYADLIINQELTQISSGLAWLGAVLYTLQIYFDFSGYSDMAIGLGKIFGFNFQENFRYPYLSCSIQEFWRRWHISLSTWFRDYVYIPLGGSRVPKWRNCLNLLITFLVSGFWHGSSLTYIFWGAVHGLLQIVETFIYPKTRRGVPVTRKKHWWQLPITFAILCFTWIFFRANTIQDAFWIISRLFWDIGRPVNYLKTAVICLDMPYLTMFGMMLPAAALLLYDMLSLKQDVIALVSRQRAPIRWGVYVVLLVVIALFSHKGIATEFIYFQF